jgi:hypothetical protein
LERGTHGEEGRTIERREIFGFLTAAELVRGLSLLGTVDGREQARALRESDTAAGGPE